MRSSPDSWPECDTSCALLSVNRLGRPGRVEADASRRAVATNDHLDLNAAVTVRIAERVALRSECCTGHAQPNDFQRRWIGVKPRHRVRNVNCGSSRMPQHGLALGA